MPTFLPTPAAVIPTAQPSSPKQQEQQKIPLIWWNKLGDNIDGKHDMEQFGTNLAFSANGNIMVGAALVQAIATTTNETNSSSSSSSSSTTIMTTGQVRAYQYVQDMENAWQPLGQLFIDTTTTSSSSNGVRQADKISLSPSGKYLAVATFPAAAAAAAAAATSSSGTMDNTTTPNYVRVFRLVLNTTNNNNNNNNSNEDNVFLDNPEDSDEVVAAAVVWQQLGSDIASPSLSFGHALSLTDNLVLCVSSDYQPGVKPGKIFTFAYNSSMDDWVGLGGAPLEHYGNSLKLVERQDSTRSETSGNTTMLLLAVGGWKRARTFRYNAAASDASSWMPYGSDVTVAAGSKDVMVDLSSDGSVLVVGVEHDVGGHGAGRQVRVLSYDADRDEWTPLGSDLQDDSFVFGNFALSANGKVVATTTYDLVYNLIDNTTKLPKEDESMGQIRIWDYIATAETNDDKGGRVVQNLWEFLADRAGNSDSTSSTTNATSGNWVQRIGTPALQLGLPGSKFGWKVALSENGDRLASSMPLGINKQGAQSGKVGVFELLLPTSEPTSSKSPSTTSSPSSLLRTSSSPTSRPIVTPTSKQPSSSPTAFPSSSPSSSNSKMPTSNSPTTAPPASTATPTEKPTLQPSRRPLVWNRLGSNIDGKNALESFGTNLAFSADGGIVVGAALLVNNETTSSTSSIMTGEVRAYKYQKDTDEWRPLGEYIDRGGNPAQGVLQPNKLSLSPNGKFLAIVSYPSSGANVVRVFALNSTDTNTNSPRVVAWEQVGMNIASPTGSSSFGHAVSLTDNLVLAVSSDYNPGLNPGKIHTFSFDSSVMTSSGVDGDWLRMGPAPLEHYGNSLRLAKDGTGSLLLAAGGLYRARTFRYDPNANVWNQYGPELTAPMPNNPAGGQRGAAGVQLDFSMDGSILGVRLENDTGGWVRFFSYEEDWIQLGNDLKADPGFIFGAFALSANGRVLATATEARSSHNTTSGQIRIYDLMAYVFNGESSGKKWIERSGPLVRGIPGSMFGYKVALSKNGDRLAASATMALNRNGVRSGKVRVFELL
jgi:hypothetical protein